MVLKLVVPKQKEHLSWLFIIDPIEKLKKSTDSTYLIMAEAYKRGITVYYTQPKTICLKKESPCATVQEVKFSKKENSKITKFTLKNKKTILLNETDLIFMRKMPPYNLTYHYTTQLLSLTKTRVINNPNSLRDFNEKLIMFNFSKIIPKTIISCCKETITSFIKKNKGTVILKKLHSYNGKEITKVSLLTKKEKINAMQKIATFTKQYTTPIMVQEFLPNIVKGDKRIFTLGDKILGVANRLPKKGSYLTNTSKGGTYHKTTLTKKEHEILKPILAFLKRQDITLAGIDIIDNKLTEINITCPGGIGLINQIENKQLEKEVVDYCIKLINREPYLLHCCG